MQLKKEGGLEWYQLIVMSMGHWRSSLVWFLILPTSFHQRSSFSAKYRHIIKRLKSRTIMEEYFIDTVVQQEVKSRS